LSEDPTTSELNSSPLSKAPNQAGTRVDVSTSGWSKEVREWFTFAIFVAAAIGGLYKFVYEETIKPKFITPTLDLTASMEKVGDIGNYHVIRIVTHMLNPSQRTIYINATWFNVTGYKISSSNSTPVSCDFIVSNPLNRYNRVARCSTKFGETWETVKSPQGDTVRPKGEIVAIGKFNDENQQMHLRPDSSVSPLSSAQATVFVPHDYNLLHMELETRWTTENSFAHPDALHVSFSFEKNGSLQEKFMDGNNHPLKDEDGNPIDLKDTDPERNIATLKYLNEHNSIKSFSVVDLYIP
jgi:hypothetical protein